MTASGTQGADDSGTWSHEAFGFVQKLAQELSEGQVQLPSFPEVAIRVQRVLNNENSSVGTVVQAVSAEPALSLQVMRMANSAALNTSGRQVHDLQSAVQRIGYGMVRAAALSFVMQQLRGAEGLRPLRERLNLLWRRGVIVGTVCRVVARKVSPAEPDAALLAGLLHGVGKLYILTRLQHLPQLLEHEGTADKIMQDWHGSVGRSLLENWEMPEEFGNALAEFEDPARELRGAVNLTDLLAAAHVLADFVPARTGTSIDEAAVGEAFLQHQPLLRKMGLDNEACRQILALAIPEVQQMRSLFGT